MAQSWGSEIGICFMIGLFIAISIGVLYSAGIIIDSILPTGVTITELQFLCIFLWTVLGIVIWGFRGR